MFKLNQSQQKYLSDQCATVAVILFASLVVTRFTTDEKPFKVSIFLISLGITLTFYGLGVLLRYNLHA